MKMSQPDIDTERIQQLVKTEVAKILIADAIEKQKRAFDELIDKRIEDGYRLLMLTCLIVGFIIGFYSGRL